MNEKIMQAWDKWRKYISEGGTASWPRDEFESLIDEYEERIHSLESQLEAERLSVNELSLANQDLTHHIHSLESQLNVEWDEEGVREIEKRWIRLVSLEDVNPYCRGCTAFLDMNNLLFLLKKERMKKEDLEEGIKKLRDGKYFFYSDGLLGDKLQELYKLVEGKDESCR